MHLKAPSWSRSPALSSLSNARLEKMIRRQKILSQEVLMYQRVMEGMRKGLSFDNLLKLIINSVREGLGFRRAGIFLVDPDGKIIRLALGVDRHGRFERNKSWWPISRKRGENEMSDLVNGYLRYYMTQELRHRDPNPRYEKDLKIASNAGVPILVGRGPAIGTLFVDNLEVKRTVSRTDVASLINYATQVGLAIESFRAHEKMLNQAVTDPLTGLNNRRSFDQSLENEIGRCIRYKRCCSLIMADIDHFKRINDTYGHGAGDEVLKQVGNLLRDNVRNVDLVARVGGEEFAILLPETPPQNILVVVNRLLKKVREMNPAVRRMGSDGKRVTVSLGVSSFRKGKTTPAQLTKLADKSLYQAKHKGRNRRGPVLQTS